MVATGGGGRSGRGNRRCGLGRNPEADHHRPQQQNKVVINRLRQMMGIDDQAARLPTRAGSLGRCQRGAGLHRCSDGCPPKPQPLNLPVEAVARRWIAICRGAEKQTRPPALGHRMGQAFERL